MIQTKTIVFDAPDAFEKLELICGSAWNSNEFSLKIDGHEFKRVMEFHFDCMVEERSRFVIRYREQVEVQPSRKE